MLQNSRTTTTVRTHNDSFESSQATAPPPYSHVSGEGCTTAGNSANSSESLSQLLDKRSVFRIAGQTAIGRQVVDGNGTPLLSILRQPLSGMDWKIRTLLLNSTGKPVMEMTRIIDDKDAPVLNKTWTIYEGGRVVGILRDLDDYGEPELVGYSISGKEMFRAVELAPYSLTVRENGKDLAVISTEDNRGSTSLIIFNQDVQLEVKALLLCCALYHDGWSRLSVMPGYVSGGRKYTLQRSKRCWTWTNKPGTKESNRICGAFDMAIRVVLFLILIILLLFLPFILVKAT